MIRARSLATGALVFATGVALGLTSAYQAVARAPEARVESVDYVLAAVSAHRPVESAPALEAPPERSVLETQVGSASYYANSLAGRRTASGVRYDPREMIAAHRRLPFGSLLRVTNQANGRSVEVRVVDRGPFARGRVLDLSRTAAEKLGFIRRGHTRVTIEVLEYGGRRRAGN